MRNLGSLTKMTVAVLLVAVWASEARADPADTSARALVAAWKDVDPNMAAVAEVIASAFASGLSLEGFGRRKGNILSSTRIERRPSHGRP